MVYKKGTPEYEKWKKSPAYDLWREQDSMAHKGKRRSAESRAKQSAAISGKRNHNYGKHLTEEHRRKISEAQRGERGNFYGKHHTAETRAKIRAAKIGQARPDLSGSNHPMWRGGISFAPYPVSWNHHLREAIRKRDNYTCVLCGKSQSKRRFEVHHINYDKEDSRPENLATLCITCHRKTGSDREYWENLFVMVYVPDFPKERITKNESNC